MELLELYYKRYIGTVEPSNYVEWASLNLHMEFPEVKKLSSMDMKENLNIFEIEKMFDDAMKSIKWEAPSKEQCLDYHIKELHSQLLLPAQNAMLIVKEIYDCTIKHEW